MNYKIYLSEREKNRSSACGDQSFEERVALYKSYFSGKAKHPLQDVPEEQQRCFSDFVVFTGAHRQDENVFPIYQAACIWA